MGPNHECLLCPLGPAIDAAGNPILQRSARDTRHWPVALCPARSIVLDTGTPLKCSRSRLNIAKFQKVTYCKQKVTFCLHGVRTILRPFSTRFQADSTSASGTGSTAILRAPRAASENRVGIAPLKTRSMEAPIPGCLLLDTRYPSLHRSISARAM